MEQKDKQLFTEIILTYLLMVLGVFLLKFSLFWQYQLFLAGGSAAGFAFGWYNRKDPWAGIKYLVDLGVLITVGWIVYRVYRSTFLYKEVIAILIQGVTVLEVIFSFNCGAPGKISYLKILSLLVFMTSPVFAVAYSFPLSILYLLVWLLILRFQLIFSSQPVQVKIRRYYSLGLALIFFSAAILAAWFISSNLYLGRINKGRLLLDEDLQDSGSGGGRESSQADKFYSLQDQLQKNVTDLALGLDSYEKRRQIIYLFSQLVKDSTKTMEADKAEIGLIDILKRQGAGLEGTAQTITFLKSYLNKKGSQSLQKRKEEITEELKKYPLGIVDRIKIISLANKIQQTNSYQRMQESSRALQKAIRDSSLDKGAQRKISALARELTRQKSFELYRNKVQDVDEETSSLKGEFKKEIEEASSDVKHTAGLDDFKLTAAKIRRLKNDPRVSEEKASGSILKKLEDAARIKLDLLFAEKAEEVRGNASKKLGSGAAEGEFDDKMNKTEGAKEPREFKKDFSELGRYNRESNLGLAGGLSQMLDLKTEAFRQEKKDKLDSMMSKDLSSEARKEISKTLDEMSESDFSRNLEDQMNALRDMVKKLQSQGDLSPEAGAELLKEARELKELLDSRIKAEAELKSQGASPKERQAADYIEQLRQAIEDSSLSSQEKEVLKALSEQLFKAQNLSQLEEIKDALEKEISSLGKGSSNKDRELLSAMAQNLSVDLQNKIEKLEDAASGQVKRMQEELKRMQESRDSRELGKNAEDLKEAIKSNTAQDKQEQEKMLEAVERLKDTLLRLLDKKAAGAAELKKNLEKIEDATFDQVTRMQEGLKRMQDSRDKRELEKNSENLKDTIKSSTAQEEKNISPEKDKQSEMLKAVEALEEALSSLIQEESSSAEQLQNEVEGLENAGAGQIARMQEEISRMRQSRDSRELEKNAGDLKEDARETLPQDSRELSEVLKAIEKLREDLSELLNNSSPRFEELKKEINNLENVSAGQMMQMQESLQKMQNSRDSRELKKNAGDLKESIKSSTARGEKEDVLREKGKQSEMLKAVEALEEELSGLLQEESSRSGELKNKVERLENADMAQEKLNKMRQSRDSRELERSAEGLKNEVKAAIPQGGRELSALLEAIERLRETLSELIKNDSPRAAELKKNLDSLENVAAEQTARMQESLKKMWQSRDERDLKKNAAELKEAIKKNIPPDKKTKGTREQARMLEAVERLKDTLLRLLDKRDAGAKELQNRIKNLENATSDQVRMMQDALKKMQDSRDKRELEKNSEDLQEAIKSNTAQDKQEQARMLEALERLEETLSSLLEKKLPTDAELREINRINEKAAQAAAIKQQFLMSKALMDVLERIEKLSLQDPTKARALKDKLEQMRDSQDPKEVEKLIQELKDVLNSSSSQEENKNDKDNNGAGNDWKIYILPYPLVVSPETALPLKVVSVYKDGYVKELSSGVDWTSTNRQVAWVDDANLLRAGSKGSAVIKASYKGASSRNTEVTVVGGVDRQTEDAVKWEIGK